MKSGLLTAWRIHLTATVLLALCPTAAFAGDYPFSGFFAYGHSKEAMTKKFLELSCAFRPSYTDRYGRRINYVLDLAGLKKDGKLTYVQSDAGWTASYDPNSKTIVEVPTFKNEGNGYYDPKIVFRSVQSQDKDTIELISFRGIKYFYDAVILNNAAAGEHGVLIRCPFSEQNYFKHVAGLFGVPSISKADMEETFHLAEGMSNDDVLFQAVKSQLQ